MKISKIYIALTAITLSGCAAMTSPTPAQVTAGMLTNPAGMALYTFDKDTPNKSVCYGQCAVNWPPFSATKDAKETGSYSLVTRDDGTKQWAYKGQPLYTWVKDQKPGDQTGDGVNSLWHTAKP